MFKLASSIGLAVALADLKRRINHWIRSGILGAVGALFAVIALVFFLVALHLFLSDVLNPVASALIIGGVTLLVALILFFVASRPLAAKTPTAAGADAAIGIGNAAREGLSWFTQGGGGGPLLRNPLFPAAVLALLAGIFLGRRSKRDRHRDEDEG